MTGNGLRADTAYAVVKVVRSRSASLTVGSVEQRVLYTVQRARWALMEQLAKEQVNGWAAGSLEGVVKVSLSGQIGGE